MSKQDVVDELHRPARKNFARRRTIIKGLDDLWEADIGEFRNYSRDNKSFKYILFVIDAFSKYLWTEPLKTKNATDVKDAMSKIVRSGRTGNNLLTDMGTEFYNKHFKLLMQKYNINHYSVYSTKKAAIAERVIRTIKNKLYKHFSLTGKYKWIDVLTPITDQYNKTRHRTTGMRPCDVTSKNEKILLSSVYSNIKVKGKSKFKLGDIVRISKYKSLFDKGYTPNWSTELFNIVKVKITNPATYLLEDMNGKPILGSFYESELQRAKHKDVYLIEKVLRSKGRKLYVKFLGLDKSHNAWLDKSDLL